MAHSRLGFVSKSLALLTSTLVLTGCYKIEIKETLNIDGTSNLAIKMDISQMMNGMNQMAEGFSDNLNASITPAFTGMDQENFLNEETKSFTGCNDPLLLKDFGVTDLTEAEKQTVEFEVTKATSCELADEEGLINIVETYSNDPSKTNILERKADSCEDPAILAFYQLSTFQEPILETFTVQNQITTSCRENDVEVIVSTLTTEIPEGEAVPASYYFNKIADPIETGFNADEFSGDIDMMMGEFDSLNAEEALGDISFCENNEQDPAEMPFFFEKCEDLGPGVGAFHFTKFDTTGFTINSNGTVTYDLEPSTQAVQDDLNQNMDQDQSDQAMPFEMDPEAMGFVVEYVLVSPWPILEYSMGELEDQYTLRVNLLEAKDSDSLSVTLDTDGNSLDLLNPSTKTQIDSLIDNLKEKLTSSDAPLERQVEYIFHLSNKIQRLAAIKPEVQVPLGYLQTKLIMLAEELQNLSFDDIEDDFLMELDALTEESFNEESEMTDTDSDTEDSDIDEDTSDEEFTEGETSSESNQDLDQETEDFDQLEDSQDTEDNEDSIEENFEEEAPIEDAILVE